MVRMIKTDRFLEIFPMFRKGSQRLVKDIMSYGRYRRVPSNTNLQLEGEPCHDLSLVLTGEKRIYKVSDTGREITLYVVGPGEICIMNASSILSNTDYPANVTSSTAVDMFLLPAKSFRELIAKYEEMRTFVFSHINYSFTTALELIVEVAFRRMDERLVDYLVERSQDNKLYTTHQEIANDLGTAREVVSRLLKDFEKRGMVVLSRNQIQLINL
jgi:CRP/FNR family transcriptional regulator